MLVPTDLVPGRLLSRHGRTRAPRLLGVLRSLLPWMPTKPKIALDLHEHGIVAHHAAAQKSVFVPFMAMADLCLYRTDHRLFGPANALAFRRGPGDAWIDVLDDDGDGVRLRGEIIGGQLRERGPLALRSLEAGEVLTFRTISDADRLAARAQGAAAFATTTELQLSRVGLDVDGQRIAIEEIAKLDEGGPDGSLRLFDAHGYMLWSVHTLSLFSADLFIVLMRTMIEAHQYGLPQKNRPPEIHTRAADAGGAGDVTGREDGES